MDNSYCCCICDKQASRVCVHPKCEDVPFICEGKCKYQRDMAIRIHTHDQSIEIITIQELNQILSSTNKEQHNQNINQIRERVDVIIKDLNQMVGRYQSQIRQVYANVKSIAYIKQLLKTKQKNHNLKGSDLFSLVDSDDRERNININYQLQISLESSMQTIIQDIQKINLTTQFQEKPTQNQQKQLYQPKQTSINKYTLQKITDCLQGLAVQFESSNNIAAAIKTYSKIIKINNKHSQSFCQRGVLYYQQDNYQAAISDFSEAIKSNLDDPIDYYYQKRGDAYVKLKKNKQAIEDFTVVLQIHPTPNIYYKCANAKYYQKNYKGAIQDCTQAIQRYPMKKYYKLRADCYQKMGKMNLANQDVKKSETAPQSMIFD